MNNNKNLDDWLNRAKRIGGEVAKAGKQFATDAVEAGTFVAGEAKKAYEKRKEQNEARRFEAGLVFTSHSLADLPAKPFQSYTISVPTSLQRDGDTSTLMIRDLARMCAAGMMLSLETGEGKVHWKLTTGEVPVPPLDIQAIVKSHYPMAVIEVADPVSTEGYVSFVVYRPVDSWYDPIAVNEDFRNPPLASLANLMHEADKLGVSMRFNILLNQCVLDPVTAKEARDDIKTGLSRTGRGLWRIVFYSVGAAFLPFAFGSLLFGGGLSVFIAPISIMFKSANQHQGAWQKLQRAKVDAANKFTCVRVLMIKSNDSAALSRWANHFQERINALYGGRPIADNQIAPTQYALAYANAPAPADPQQAERWRAPDVLTADELATFWHLPTKNFANHLLTMTNEAKPSKNMTANSDGIVIGTHKGTPIRIKYENRDTHINILGRAGTGKSRLLSSLISQDIENGMGVCVIDPHGTLVNQILESGVTNDRVDDVFVYDLADTDFPIPLNPFAVTDTDKKPGTGLFRETFARVYPGIQGLARTQTCLKNTLELVRRIEEPTVRDVYRVLTDLEYLEELIIKLEDDLDDFSLDYWDKWLNMGDKRDEIHQPITTRIIGIVQSPNLYHALCHPRSIDWDHHIEQKHIVLVPLHRAGKDFSSEDVNLIGTIALGQLAAVAASRGEGKSRGFYTYVDEAQHFTNSGFDVWFTQLRKWGIGLTIANQFFDQLSAKDQEAISTAGCNILFQPTMDDARRFHPLYKGFFEPEQLLKLNLREALAVVRLGRIQERPFLIDTIDSPEGSVDRGRQIRQHALRTHARLSTTAVQQFLRGRYPRPASRRARTDFGEQKP